ncbi:MAG: alpha/beta hydrolase [candidate division NC10 bacterium]|nr:alpha/beta hydrolase [candidate division NC10 bacterium]
MRRSSLSLLFRVIVSLTVGIFLFATVQFVLAIHPLKFHSNITPLHLKLPYEDVRFPTADGLTLRGWYIPGARPKGTIIVTHGYPADKGDLLPLAQFLHPRYNLFLFDFRFFGQSEGGMTTLGYREQEDLKAAIRYLRGRGEKTIGGLGFSLGAAVLLLAEDADLKGIVADSSFADMERMVEAVYSYLPGVTKAPVVWLIRSYASLLGVDLGEIAPRRAITRAGQPILIIHGAGDRQIPVEHARLLYEAAPPGRAELWIIEGASHGGTYARDPKKYREKVLAFFGEVLER